MLDYDEERLKECDTKEAQIIGMERVRNWVEDCYAYSLNPDPEYPVAQALKDTFIQIQEYLEECGRYNHYKEIK